MKVRNTVGKSPILIDPMVDKRKERTQVTHRSTGVKTKELSKNLSSIIHPCTLR